MKPRLLQVANVGQICGGTAACAWTVTQALPGFEHHVAFLCDMTAETRRVFAGCACHVWPAITINCVRALRPDVVLLHNIAPHKLKQRLSVPTVQYVHSAGAKAAADITVYCSKWLAAQSNGSLDQVLWQAVPQVLVTRTSEADRPLVIGRICTPQLRKWPQDLMQFYSRLSLTVPDALWEFVGCPQEMQPKLRQACGGHANFYPAGWQQRQHLGRWAVLVYHHPTLPESFGRVVAEAMRAGCIPVVDDQGGFREQLDQGGGYLCRNVSEFEHALREVCSPAIRQKMSQRAREISEVRWSLDRFAQELLTCFDAAVSGPGRLK